jgi:hypothetical protein
MQTKCEEGATDPGATKNQEDPGGAVIVNVDSSRWVASIFDVRTIKIKESRITKV